MVIENIIYGIIGLFFFILIVKSLLKKRGEKICAICFSFAFAWIFLLISYYLGNFNNGLLIGLLMGLTILGIFYTLEKKVSKEKTVFRLPFLLTLVLAGYYLLTLDNLIKETIIIGILWILFGILYLYRNNLRLKKFVDGIVECCKNW